MARLPRRMPTAVAAAALLMSAVACGDSSESSVPTPEQADITIAVPRSVAAAPVLLGIDRGIFAEYGLNVRPVDLVGNGIKQLRDGDVNIALVEYAPVFADQDAKRNADEPLDLRILAEGYQAAPGVLGVVVAQSSAITEAADLAGKRIAFDQENGLGWYSLLATLQAQAVDTSAITPTYLPFDQMADALRNGSVDAAWMSEPYISRAEQGVEGANGVRRVVDTATGPTADLPISGYAARGDWVASRQDTIEAFNAAITEAKQEAADRSAVEAALVQREQLDAQTARLVSMGEFPTRLVPDRLQRVANLMELDNLVVELLTQLTPSATATPTSG